MLRTQICAFLYSPPPPSPPPILSTAQADFHPPIYPPPLLPVPLLCFWYYPPTTYHVPLCPSTALLFPPSTFCNLCSAVRSRTFLQFRFCLLLSLRMLCYT